MEQVSITDKHTNELQEFDNLKRKEWQELLDRQEARLMKRNGKVDLYSLFAWERVEFKKQFEKMKTDLQQRQQRELAEHQKIQQFRNCGDEF